MRVFAVPHGSNVGFASHLIIEVSKLGCKAIEVETSNYSHDYASLDLLRTTGGGW